MADYNSAYTGAQIDANLAKAATATQPGDLATVATSGDYDDLTGKPTLGTAAATAASAYATAAQGALADTAVQPAAIAKMVVSDTTGITGADAIANVVSLTQAEYDALTPDADTLYVVI
jgi:hypothetical protein